MQEPVDCGEIRSTFADVWNETRELFGEELELAHDGRYCLVTRPTGELVTRFRAYSTVDAMGTLVYLNWSEREQRARDLVEGVRA